jgi:cell division inhibitor SepF
MFDKIREKLSRVAKNEEEEIVFKKLEEDEIDLKSGVEHPVYEDEEEPKIPEEKKSKSFLEGGNIELKVVRPESISEVSTIADHLLRGCTVVLNLELLDKETITRMLDFLRGVAYTIDGEISHVSKATYIITANGIDISDSI